MKILVYGAGVLGSIFAARLHKGGHDASRLPHPTKLPHPHLAKQLDGWNVG